VKLDFRDPARASWDSEIDRIHRYFDRHVALPDLTCPYPGMRPFGEDDAGRFFGRETEVDTIMYRLRHGEREIYVIGASGSGKSSLINAGLIPRLAQAIEGLPRFCVRTFRPGERPLERLAGALEGDTTMPGAAVEQLLARHAPATSLLLVIDQLEELFAIASDGQRTDFLAAMRVLRAESRCVLLFTLRADFYGAFLMSSLWIDNGGRISRIDLRPLGSDSLRVVIEHPARELGVHVEPELVSRLVDDAAQEPGALPLLQETLFQLWGTRRERLLALADYRALSNGARTGLAFAVEKHADFVLGRLASAQRTIAFRILLRLVNFGEGRADTRRQQPCDALRSHDEPVETFRDVLQCLVDHRLVTVSGDDHHSDVRVDLAHEILIQAWLTFADWIRTWRAQEQCRRELEAAAAIWRAASGGDDGLLGPARLAAALVWRHESAQVLGHTADLGDFIAASEVAQFQAIRQRRRARLTLMVVPLTVVIAIVMSTLALVADGQRRDALKQRNERNRLVAESVQLYQDIGSQQLNEAERPLQALPYLVAAREATEISNGALSPDLQMLFAAAARNLPMVPQMQHQGAVVSATFSPDGTRVVTGSLDGTAQIWDAVTGKPLSPPLQHKDGVESAAFSLDGTRVVTASADKTARVWDAVTGSLLCQPLQHQDAVVRAAFSRDGTRIVTASKDKTARVWNAATGKQLALLRHQEAVLNAAFNPEGTRVVTASADKTARVWDAATGKQLASLQHQKAVWSVAFSPDGARIVTTSEDATAHVWVIASGEQLALLRHQKAVGKAAFSPDGTRVATASEDGTARIWDVTTGAQPISLQHKEAVWSVAFSPDGARIVTASEDKTARIWDATTGDPLSLPLQHQEVVVGASFSPDGTRVVTASWDNTARVWDARPLPAPLRHQGVVWSALFNSDGTRIITASGDKTACIWDAASGTLSFPCLQHEDVIWSAAFSPDGTRVVTASKDHTARVWDAATGRPLVSLQHQDAVWMVAFSPDGTRVVTASNDHTVRVWDVATGRPLVSLQHQDAVWMAAFSPDGTRVVTASKDHTARVWRVATGMLVVSLQHQDAVWMAAFSPDGTHVVTASEDKTARIWDSARGIPLGPPLQHQGAVLSAAFSSDGTRIVTASEDQTGRVWDAVTGTLMFPPLQHQDAVVSAAFSPDGAHVVTASKDKTARLWDAATGKSVSPWPQHRETVWSAAFSPDGTRVVTASKDKTARVWEVPLASGTLEEWRATMNRASPYTLINGVLCLRTTIRGSAGVPACLRGTVRGATAAMPRGVRPQMTPSP